MLSKPATMLLGLINEKPLNAYEITKMLSYMNVRWWFNIADSTVYTTIKNLEKKKLISGVTEKVGNMPNKTVYTLTEQGHSEFLNTLRKSICQVDFDTNIFTIAAFFIDAFDEAEKQRLLKKRLQILNDYLIGIKKQDNPIWERSVSASHVANIKRMIDIIAIEIAGTQKLLNTCGENHEK